MPDQLNDCPFCGASASARSFADAAIVDGKRIANHYVECNSCEAGSGAKMTAAEAMEAWNRRP